jgi:hypothetical protein
MYALRGMCLSYDADNYDCDNERKLFHYNTETTKYKNRFYKPLKTKIVVIDIIISS